MAEVVKSISTNRTEPRNLARYQRGSLNQEARNLREIFAELAETRDEVLIAQRIKQTYVEEVVPHVKKIYKDPFLSVVHHLIFKDKSPRRVVYNKKHGLVLKIKTSDSIDSGYGIYEIPFHVNNVIRRARQGKVALT